MSDYPTELPPSVRREELHQRDYEFRGYLRGDGLFDLEGRMTDSKAYDFPNQWRGTIRAGTPYHDMRIRLTLDADFVIHDVVVVTAASPYEICPAITPAFQALRGAELGIGWTRLLRQHFAGTHGCTHHVEMLRAMGTVAFQTLYGYRERVKRDRAAASEEHSTAQDDGTRGNGTQGDGNQGDGVKRKPGFLDTCHALATDGEVVREHWSDFYTGPDGPQRPSE